MNRETTVHIHETLSFFVSCFMQLMMPSPFIVGCSIKLQGLKGLRNLFFYT